MKIELICGSCHRHYLPSEHLWRCICGGFLSLDFHARFPLKEIEKRKPTLWRYREALPILNDNNIISFNEGFTPLVEEQLFGKKVMLKQDHLFPSGSFKDRGASVLISKIKELGIKKVVEDSSGNAGAAIAAYCAKAHIACHIYVPEKTSAEKLRQIERYGAHLYKIHGTREDTAQAVLKGAQTTYYASHYYNPYFFHGTKTFIFETVEQLGWMTPDVLLIPVGNGTLLYGCYIGLKELQKENIIHKIPKIIGIQAQNCAPLKDALKKSNTFDKSRRIKNTIAEGIAIERPMRIKEIIYAIKETNGDIISVNEKEILHALDVSFQKGYCIEPTSAVAIAGLKKYPTKQKEIIVLPLTGHGLKTLRK